MNKFIGYITEIGETLLDVVQEYCYDNIMSTCQVTFLIGKLQFESTIEEQDPRKLAHINRTLCILLILCLNQL